MFIAFPFALALALSVSMQDPTAAPAEPTSLAAVVKSVESAGEGAKGMARMEAVKAAAEKALKDNSAALASGDGVYYRGLLLARADHGDEAVDTLTRFAADNPDHDFAHPARFEALLIAARSNAPAAILEQANVIDESRLEDEQKQILGQLKSQMKAQIDGDRARDALNGHPVPEFEVIKVLNAPAFDLAALKGKVVVLDFFATWCPPCRVVVPDLVAMQKKHGGAVQVVGVTRYYGYGMDFSDPAAEKPHGGKTVGRKPNPALNEEEEVAINEAFIKAFELNYPLIFTAASVSKEQFKVSGIPTVYVLGKDGKVLGSSVGSGERSHAKIEQLIKDGLAGHAN